MVFFHFTQCCIYLLCFTLGPSVSTIQRLRFESVFDTCSNQNVIWNLTGLGDKPGFNIRIGRLVNSWSNCDHNVLHKSSFDASQYQDSKWTTSWIVCPIESKVTCVQSCALLNWKYFRFRCGCTPVTVNWFLLLFHTFLQYLRKLYIVWSLVRRLVTRRLTRLKTMYNENDEIMSKNQFTGTATQPQCNRKFCQFNKDQNCICASTPLWSGGKVVTISMTH